MEGEQPPTKGKESLLGGEDLVEICVPLPKQCGHRAVNCWGVNPQAHKAHGAGHHVDVGGPWHGILK